MIEHDFTKPVHGTIPQNLIEKIIRLRIYESRYWKEHCFALTAELLVDKAVKLQFIGGVCSENNKPTPFLCLILKMLQIQPEVSVAVEFVRNEEYKYVRCLGAFYLRLIGNPIQIYKELEPLYRDYRKVRFQTKSGWKLLHMDEWIDNLLHDDIACNIVLPRLLADGYLKPQRESALQSELEMKDEGDGDESSSLSSDTVSSDSEDEKKQEPADAMEIEEKAKSSSDTENTRKRKLTAKKKKKKKEKKKKTKKQKKKRKLVVKGLKATPKIATGLEKLAETESMQPEEKVMEGTVEYWNQQRIKLGLKPLNPS